jgi:hypothetical protein
MKEGWWTDGRKGIKDTEGRAGKKRKETMMEGRKNGRTDGRKLWTGK